MLFSLRLNLVPSRNGEALAADPYFALRLLRSGWIDDQLLASCIPLCLKFFFGGCCGSFIIKRAKAADVGKPSLQGVELDSRFLDTSVGSHGDESEGMVVMPGSDVDFRRAFA